MAYSDFTSKTCPTSSARCRPLLIRISSTKTPELMAYSDFTLEKVRVLLGVDYEQIDFLPNPLPAIAPSADLSRTLHEASDFYLLSEKAKSEFLIVPVLRELNRNNPGKFTVFSGVQFDVNEKLSGFCDFLLSNRPRLLEVRAPVFCVVEAKNRTVQEGLGQCGAEMLAAWEYNGWAGEPTSVVFGAVTTGTEWLFLQYRGDKLQIETQSIFLTDLPHLLGALQTVVESYQ